MIKLQTYLSFMGNAEEAFNFYKSVFGGELTLTRYKDLPLDAVTITEDNADKVMHVSLPIGNDVLMGGDTLESFGPPLVTGNNIYIPIIPDTKEEADRLFCALSEGGAVEMPMDDVPWGDYYGSFADRFGVMWMVIYSYK